MHTFSSNMIDPYKMNKACCALNTDELIGLGSICNSGGVIIKGCATISIDNELEKSLSDFIKKSLDNSTFSFCGYTPGEIKRLVEDFFIALPNDI